MLAHSVSGGGKWENTFCDMQLPAVCQRQKAGSQPSMMPPTTPVSYDKLKRREANNVCRNISENNNRIDSDCRFQGLITIPIRLPKTIIHLNLSHNHISRFKPKNLQRLGTRYLETLDLSYNNFEVLEAYQFNYLVRNKFRQSISGAIYYDLRLSNNNMRMIDPNAFRADRTDHLVLEMSALYLDHNKLTSLPPHMFDDADHAMNKLDVSYNMISNIRGDEIPSIRYLGIRNVDLSFNLLKSVPTLMITDRVEHLNVLNLEGNQISLIRNNAFARARKVYEWSYLENLNVAGNFITKIEPKAFHGRAAALLNLNLTRNLLTSLHGVQNLHLLRHLDISYNRMQEIQLPSDIGLHKLRTLNLKGNVIKVVRNGDLAHINHLYQVDLSDNVIDTIEPSAFYHMPSLSNLDLSNNQITSLPGEMFLSVGFTSINVTQINLKGNQFVRSAFCNLTVLFESLSLTTKTSRAQLVPTFLSRIEPADLQLRLTKYANDNIDDGQGTERTSVSIANGVK
ncbi:leucine-rich repeat-containing G-protein coupled receptor 5-like [Sycon ciliatum]|uniref:leucine-rich repeat-containing G-protein coupled receptor 5-like n=1 Tax=Sycon ciliatum TaxID=27933 RepID=UPI0031F6BE29